MMRVYRKSSCRILLSCGLQLGDFLLQEPGGNTINNTRKLCKRWAKERTKEKTCNWDDKE